MKTTLLCGGLGGKHSTYGPTSVYTEDTSFPGAQIIKPEGESSAMLTRSIEFGRINMGMPSSIRGGQQRIQNIRVQKGSEHRADFVALS